MLPCYLDYSDLFFLDLKLNSIKICLMKKLTLISTLLPLLMACDVDYKVNIDSDNNDKYCWVNGDNFHDIKVAINKDCNSGDLLWVVTNSNSLDEWNIEQTIGQYCQFKSEIIVRKRNDGNLYLQCILQDKKSRGRRTR